MDYNFEGVFQWGRFGGDRIEAWTAASDTGYTFASAPLEPRAGLKADIISGDRDPDSGRLETFNPLFPRGAYFGEIALIGPANLIDIHPSIDLQLLKQLSLSADCDLLWRQSLKDGIYGNGVYLIRSGATSRARYIGTQASARIDWRVDRHVSISLAYSHFFAGAFIRGSGPGDDVDFVGAWAAYRF